VEVKQPAPPLGGRSGSRNTYLVTPKPTSMASPIARS